ncbi:MAG TPA: periplasmic heavy metal sensor [Pyrinomonadaceae bacterium]|nr:periplasmic heavy metal sensor [Pyrinomonadaceae bacterium]
MSTNSLMRNKWQVRLVALGIFVLGFAAGALALNAYRGWARGRARADAPHLLFKRLNLTDEQRTQAEQILSDARRQMNELRRESEPRFAEIRRQADERLRQVLTPEQFQQFQQLKEEARGRRRGRGRRGGPPEP